MIHELRIYKAKVGQLGVYMELFQNRGLEIATRHLDLLGFWTSDYGDLNQVYHLWAFHDFADRLTRRAALQADPDWQAFAPQLALKWMAMVVASDGVRVISKAASVVGSMGP